MQTGVYLLIGGLVLLLIGMLVVMLVKNKVKEIYTKYSLLYIFYIYIFEWIRDLIIK